MKKFSVLVRGITLNHVGNFCYLKLFLHKFKKHEKEIDDYCYAEIPNEDKKNIKPQL